MKVETKVIINALRLACRKSTELDKQIRGFMKYIPAITLSVMLDKCNAEVKVLLEELRTQMDEFMPLPNDEVVDVEVDVEEQITALVDGEYGSDDNPSDDTEVTETEHEE